VDQLNKQLIEQELFIIVVNSNSSDGTTELLEDYVSKGKIQKHIKVNRNFWWARSANTGMAFLQNVCSPVDLVLLLNDDVLISRHYLRNLVYDFRILNNPKVILCSTRVEVKNGEGFIQKRFEENNYYLNRNQMVVEPRYIPSKRKPILSPTCTGRGMLLPGSVITNKFEIDWKRFPQHLADLNFSLTLSTRGYKIYYSNKSIVYSCGVHGSDVTNYSFFKRYFSTGSGNRLLSHYFFWKDLNPGISTILMIIKFLSRNIQRKILNF
jgi:GT2 family glycosyltransferase